MILHYLYVGQHGILRDVEFRFSDRYTIELNSVRSELTIIKNDKQIPDGFFSIDAKQRAVDCVSAVVGNNGAGKTTIAGVLSRLMSGQALDTNKPVALLFSAQDKNKKDTLFFYRRGEIKCFHMEGNGCMGEKQEILPISEINDFLFLYITNNYDPFSYSSPIISTGDAVIDLSQSRLLRTDYFMRWNPRQGDTVSDPAHMILSHEETELAFAVSFFEACLGKKDKQQSFEVPIPQYICVKVGSDERFKNNLRCLATNKTGV